MYDLKRDVYRCYLTAKEDPIIGYMKRPKEKWDEIHPEYSFRSDKNLRDQASRIEKNKDVMDTEYVNFRSNNNSEVDEQTDYSNNCSETVISKIQLQKSPGSDLMLINKSIMSEVRNKKRNLITIWLDYKKAFDSVPHEWLIQSLYLAKLPEDLIRAIEHLTSQWSTVLHLKGEEEVIVSDIIYFVKGIFQGDSLSVLLFILSVNPHKNYNVTHNFFVDDLKLYASSVNTAKKQLNLVTEFSKDTGMTFGDDKCAYQQIQNGKLLKCTNNLKKISYQ